MVLREVTVLTDTVRVLRPVKVWTGVSGFLASIGVVAVLAHALGIENAINVQALHYFAARDTLLGLLRLFGLASLPALADATGWLGATRLAS